MPTILRKEETFTNPYFGGGGYSLIGKVKSIQKGVTLGTSSSIDRIVQINPVNPNKCFIYLENSVAFFDAATNIVLSPPFVTSFTQSFFSIRNGSRTLSGGVQTAYPINWTIIEFE